MTCRPAIVSVALIASSLLLGSLLPQTAAADPVQVKMHNALATEIINGTLQPDFWDDADIRNYKNQLYDEIRIKPHEAGYVPLITGEGNMDYEHDVVQYIVFNSIDQVPNHMVGAKAIVELGSGYDPYVGSEYHDYFYFVDLTAFYATFTQRIYHTRDEENDKTYLYFERVTPEMVDAATWTAYNKRIDDISAGIDVRWVFGSVIPATDVFGMYTVEKGTERQTRVTLVSKIMFGSETSWIAQMGSEMPMVIRGGLKSGFDSCVAVARDEQERRTKKAAADASE